MRPPLKAEVEALAKTLTEKVRGMKLEEVRELPVEKRPLITALVWLVLGLVAAAFAGGFSFEVRPRRRAAFT